MKNVEFEILDYSLRGVSNSYSSVLHAVNPLALETMAEERKAALRKIPEQAILSEVRRMVEEMQTLNKKLEETEAAIEEYFKPIDKEAEIIMKMQLEGEDKSMKEMMKAMQTQATLEKAEAEKTANAQIQAMLEKAEAERTAKAHNFDGKQQIQETDSPTKQHSQMR
ncbi:uncharacterized protein LOC105632341 isoform X3 [Jatropha curcas]|uniref:uncharacterized protein LOC105632341 isoform X3 n=1 Tax=Jatropha curcas TaxID=180498 RepID=UPI0005FB8843|nr:uncharacterized protein LOC105632341 isoform X3 [Jatropha curcas]